MPFTSFTQFRDDITVDPNQTYQITTSYSYTLFRGTLKVQSITTTWPVVSTAQNGSGVADSRTVFFDAYANPVWLKDERGFIFYSAFDVTTGAVIQTIADFNTSTPGQPTPPSGWTTPSGGGLNLTTDITVDALGPDNTGSRPLAHDRHRGRGHEYPPCHLDGVSRRPIPDMGRPRLRHARQQLIQLIIK
jgi:hypothetical protein